MSEEEKSRGYFSLENYTFTDNAIGIGKKEGKIKEMFNHALNNWEISDIDSEIMRNGIDSINGKEVDLDITDDDNE